MPLPPVGRRIILHFQNIGISVLRKEFVSLLLTLKSVLGKSAAHLTSSYHLG